MTRPSARIRALALAALGAVVIATGVLQYRWIDQASTAQNAQTMSRIRDGITQVVSTLDMQVTRAVLVFTRPDGDGPLVADGIEQRWAAWTAAPSARLVTGVTVLESTGNGWQTRSWGRASSFDPASVVGASDLSASKNGSPVRVIANTRAVFIGDQPSVVAPLPDPPAFPPRVDWIVVRFDLGALTTLVNQEIQLKIVAEDRRVYGFAVRPGNERTSGDVISVDLFRFRPDCLAPPAAPSMLSFRGVGDGAGQGGRFLTLSPGPETVDGLLQLTGQCQSSSHPGTTPGLLRIGVHTTGVSDLLTYRRRNTVLSAIVLAALVVALAVLGVSTERARRLARLQTIVTAGISHELRTPLASLSVAADHLKQGHVENVDQARRYGEIIAAQSQRLRHIVDQTLALASLTEHPRPLTRQPVPVGQLIALAVASMRAAVSQAAMTIEQYTEASTPPIDADCDLALLCLTNLIENAVKYAQSGGWIAIFAGPCEGGTSVELVVEDRGPGMDAADIAAAFEPFYRGSAARVSRQSGIGLGLAIVRAIVEAHQGRIDIYHASPNGCRVRIVFPGVRVSAAAVPRPSDA